VRRPFTAAAIGLGLFAVLAPGLARAAVPFVSCHGKSGVRCATVTVPLARSGELPGTVPLAVEELPASGMPRGVLFMIAGGPGQASAKVFDLAHNAEFLRLFFPGYSLVAFDPRGTGSSGPIDCRGLGAGRDVASFVGACGAELGPGRAFYSTRDHVEDLESVRQALGVDRVALWGTSYGTKLVLAYALAHPAQVDRLVLDSVLPPNGPDPFDTNVLQALSLGLGSICHAGSCRGVTDDLGRDVALLANRAAETPLVASVRGVDGSRTTFDLDGDSVLSIVGGADLSPGLAAELPAAVSAALAGRARPLARLAVLADASSAGSSDEFSFALGLATICADGPFPWQPDTPLEQRGAAIDSALAALPPGSTGPFGPWALRRGTAELCRLWPSPAGGAPFDAGPLPDVPVLVLAGGEDLRTPVAAGAEVAASFPRGHLLVVPGVGHAVLFSDYSRCGSDGVHRWLAGRTPHRCARVPPLVAPLGRFPRAVATTAPSEGVSGLPGRTLAVVGKTIEEAKATWLFGPGRRLPGLEGGWLRSRSDDSFSLVDYSLVPGLAVGGRIAFPLFGLFGPSLFASGTVTVSGARSAHGTIKILGRRMSGTLAGKPVSGRL
jgi:pimeloyl-ACP methyl ester carboxylesterase